MALVKQGKTSNTNIGGSYSGSWYFTLSHLQATGSDGLLVAVIAASTSISLSNPRYGGVAMSLDSGWFTGPGNLQYAVCYLANPPTGTNSITIDSNNNGTVAILAQSFTGAQTLIGVSHSVAANTPHSATIYANLNSMLMGIGVSQYSFADPAITIDGTGASFGGCDISGSVSSAQFCAWTRDARLSAGTKTVITNTIAPSFQATNTRVEIREAVTVSAPTVTTTAISSIAQTTASSGGNVTADGGATVTARGVCWNTSGTPTTSNSKTTDGSGTGSFTSSITGLTPGTLYYVRAYATNSAGTSYGAQLSFTSLSASVVPQIMTNLFRIRAA